MAQSIFLPLLSKEYIVHIMRQIYHYKIILMKKIRLGKYSNLKKQ